MFLREAKRFGQGDASSVTINTLTPQKLSCDACVEWDQPPRQQYISPYDIRAHTHTNTHTGAQTNRKTHIREPTHSQADIHSLSHIHSSRIQAHNHTFTNTNSLLPIFSRTFTNSHTHTHTNIGTHARTHRYQQIHKLTHSSAHTLTRSLTYMHRRTNTPTHVPTQTSTSCILHPCLLVERRAGRREKLPIAPATLGVEKFPPRTARTDGAALTACPGVPDARGLPSSLQAREGEVLERSSTGGSRGPAASAARSPSLVEQNWSSPACLCARLEHRVFRACARRTHSPLRRE